MWPGTYEVASSSVPRRRAFSLPRVGERDLGGEMTAHPVHARSRPGGCRAQVDPGRGRPVGRDAERGTTDQLHEVHRAAVDVAADQVRVPSLEVGRPEDAARADDV